MSRPTLVLLALAVAALPIIGRAQSSDSAAVAPMDSTSPVDESLRSFLIAHLDRVDPWLDDTDSSMDAKVRYAAASAQLTDSGPPAALVHLFGFFWCGTGGCTTLIVDRRPGSERILAEIRLSWRPILVLPAKSHGWHDIALVDWNGDDQRWVAYRYDGHRYVRSRSTRERPAGQELIPVGATQHLLYRCRRHSVADERRDCGLPKLEPGQRLPAPAARRPRAAAPPHRKRA